jgi:starvation-inducible DNA-binding protein
LLKRPAQINFDRYALSIRAINEDYVTPLDMLAELRDDNLQLAMRVRRETHRLCEENGDVAGASLIELWIDEAEGRIWFLFESSRRSPSSVS